jgi:hypothetical protein
MYVHIYIHTYILYYTCEVQYNHLRLPELPFYALVAVPAKTPGPLTWSLLSLD